MTDHVCIPEINTEFHSNNFNLFKFANILQTLRISFFVESFPCNSTTHEAHVTKNILENDFQTWKLTRPEREREKTISINQIV